uniref:Uncharacterized protein n=1 Tax=Panagrolaimus superbus TaxID=310955 RepID=A0A914Y179_9BILA
MARTQPNPLRTIPQALLDWRFSQGNYGSTQQTQGGPSLWSQEINQGDFQEVLNSLTEVTNFNDAENCLTEMKINVLTQIRDSVRGLVCQLVINRKPKNFSVEN